MPNAKPITGALAGNPNSGKTSLFNALTGAHQHVGNYPGVTVEKREGTARLDGRVFNLVDLPGTYSLTAYSLDERVARQVIIEDKPDVVVDVVDASNLERNLYLAVQLLELGAPLVIALNMVDVARNRGLKIDAHKLSALLGAPVVPTVARSGQGTEGLLAAAARLAEEGDIRPPLEISYGTDVDETLKEILARPAWSKLGRRPVSPRWLALKWLEGDAEVIGRIREDPALAAEITPLAKRLQDHLHATLGTAPEGVITERRYGFLAGLGREVVERPLVERVEFSDRLDRVLTHRLVGPILLLALLYGIYELVFWASQVPVGWLESLFAWLGQKVEAGLPEGPLRSLLVQGILAGVGGVMSFVPLIAFMFLAIAVLEDTGYMARMAYMLDRVLRIFGLHGNSVVALVVGGGIAGGCAVPGVMAARTVRDPKARLATILTVPLLNCGAKLPVYALLIGAFFSRRRAEVMMALTLISWGLVLAASWVFRATLLKGDPAPFVMELPPYRLPTARGLLIHAWERTWQYLKKAGTVILAVSVLIWAVMTYPSLPEDAARTWETKISAAPAEARKELEAKKAQAELENSLAGRLGLALTRVTSPLGFDWRTNVALVGGFAAKEVVVSTLGTALSLGRVEAEAAEGLSEHLRRSGDWSPLKAFSLMIFVMVYAPCFVTVVMIRREAGGWGWALFAVAYTTALAYLLGLAVFQGGRALGLS